MSASTICNSSMSSASMSSWASQAHAFHQPVCQSLSTAPLERSTRPYQQSLFPFRMRSSSSMPSRASSSLDLVVTVSCGDIADLSDHCPINSLQTLEVWLCQWPSLTGMKHCTLHTRTVLVATCLEREVAERENW